MNQTVARVDIKYKYIFSCPHIYIGGKWGLKHRPNWEQDSAGSKNKHDSSVEKKAKQKHPGGGGSGGSWGKHLERWRPGVGDMRTVMSGGQLVGGDESSSGSPPRLSRP